MLSKVIFTSLLLAIMAHVATACAGYKVRITKLENCAGDDAIIQFDPNFNISLTKKCELVPIGCIINKAFATAVCKYKIVKDGNTMIEEKVDCCAMAGKASPEAQDIMKLFGAPGSCPVPAEKICSNDHKVDMSKYRAMMGIAKGTTGVHMEIEHDTGKSCFNVEFEIYKT